MPVVKGISLLQQIKDANPHWFTPENKRFFNDITYYGLYGKKSHAPYLVQKTYAWTDMFNPANRRVHYRIHTINLETLAIETLLDDEFRTYEDVKKWMEEN